MMRTRSDWTEALDRWLEPFLARLGNKTRRRMCPLYVAGLIGPGDRKGVQPMARRFAPGDYGKHPPTAACAAGNSWSVLSVI